MDFIDSLLLQKVVKKLDQDLRALSEIWLNI